jgi:type I restriction enzyme, S subunit
VSVNQEFKSHAAYRNSGAAWIGRIPSHWNAIKIRRLTQVKRGASPRPIEDPKYFDDDGEFAWVRISDVTASNKYLLATEQRLSSLGQSKSVTLQPGALFLSIAATVGKPILTKIKCCIHDGFVYFPRLQRHTEYWYYVLACGEAYKGLGKQGTQLNLNTDTVGDIVVPVPPDPEKEQIASFLDQETARLDALMAQKEKLLALLEEKRASLITHAVTHGLDPHAPTKPSGIPWPSRIPAHWEVVRLGRRIELQRGVDITKDQQNEGTVPVVSSGGIASFHDKPLVEGPGVVVGRKGTAGAVYYIESDYWPHDTTLYVNKFRGSHPRFVFYKLCSMDLASFDTGSANPTLNRNLLHPLLVAWPPPDEQVATAGQLDRQTARLDALATKIETASSLLRERRTALISAAVTGQIDVRNWKPAAP